MKSVLILGSGPAGLVAAKTLLHNHPGIFSVTILEKEDRIGGMWGVLKGEAGRKCEPTMKTNLSRFTVSFADLAWDSVDLREEETADNTNCNSSLPIFPEAWQVGRYLEEYKHRFVPAEVVHYGAYVKTAERIPNGDAWYWRVTWSERNNDNIEGVFDYLLIASGFFHEPKSSFKNQYLNTPAIANKIIHSSQLRDIESLHNECHSYKASMGKILVVGGGISGSETAAKVAFQLSDKIHRPKPSYPDHYRKARVYHVIPRPFYDLRRYLPVQPRDTKDNKFRPAPSFLPLDLVLYDLSRRGKGPITAKHGRVPPEKAQATHKFIQTLLGGSQDDLGAQDNVYSEDSLRYPPYTGITSGYSEFIRSGLVVPVRGRLENFSVPSSTHAENIVAHVSATVQQQVSINAENTFSTMEIEEISCIIDCTGFEQSGAFSWLPAKVLQELGFDPKCSRLPFLLHSNSTLNPAIPNIGFVGFYEGPFWGVMEAQSRSIASRWSSAVCTDETEEARSEIENNAKLRKAIKDRRPDVPPFMMGDYVGIIESIGQTLRTKYEGSNNSGPTYPARYAAPNKENSKTRADLENVLHESSSKARFIAAASFAGLQGRWHCLEPFGNKFLPVESLQNYVAHFHPRLPTAPGYSGEYQFTLLGLSFLIFRYSEKEDQLSIWIEDTEAGDLPQKLVGVLRICPFLDEHDGWTAESPGVRMKFRFRAAALESFSILLRDATRAKGTVLQFRRTPEKPEESK